MNFKQQVFDVCIQRLAEKISLLNASLHDLRESAKNETKSSAGDKYETARAMLQIEQENTGRQLNDVMAQKELLERIDIENNIGKVIQGSLVKTDKGIFFISIALGKIIVDNTTVLALSAKSPLGTKLLGAAVDDRIILNNTSYIIKDVK